MAAPKRSQDQIDRDRHVRFRTGQSAVDGIALPFGAEESASIAQVADAGDPLIDARVFGLVGRGDETRQLREAFAYAHENRVGIQLQAGRTYTVAHQAFDYSGDSPDAVAKGLRVPVLRGGGMRSTVVQQAVGDDQPLISYRGAISGTLHDGKVMGLNISDLELRGNGATPGIVLSIFNFGALERLYLQGFTDAIVLDRPVKAIAPLTPRDDHSQDLTIDTVKLFGNVNGVLCTGDGDGTPGTDGQTNAVGNVTFINVSATYNTRIGFDLVSNHMTLLGCNAIGNLRQGLRVRNPTNPASNGFGPSFVGFRCEGNGSADPATYAEIDIDGATAISFLSLLVIASFGADCLRAGATQATRDLLVHGRLIGNGGAGTGRTGQKALVIGAQCFGFRAVNLGIDTSQFADASAAVNPMLVIADSGNSTKLDLSGTQSRTAEQFILGAAGSVAVESRVFADSNRRWMVRADGYQEWGAGNAAADTTLSRTAANTLSMGAGDSFKVDGTWNGGAIQMGSYYLWVDGTGRFRIKSGAPTSDTDGTVVGTQS